MVLRMRFASGSRPARTGVSFCFVVAAYSLLQPVAMALWCLAAWRLGMDLGWTSRFPIRSGLLSHWQAWIAIAFTTQFAGYLLQSLIPLPGDRRSPGLQRRQASATASSSSR